MYTLNVYIDNGKMNARSKYKGITNNKHQMSKMLEMARLMRGMVPEWDNSYIEEQLPNDLLVKMMNTDKWTDDDGFHWGFGRLYATTAVLLRYGTPMRQRLFRCKKVNRHNDT
jgi:hypothetical protein